MITAKLLREWSACWDDARISEKLGARESVAPRQVAADESISLDDRLWVVCRAIWYLDESAARLFAIESASLVAHLTGDEADQAQYLGLLNDLVEIEDLPVEQRSAARDAAWSAARAARDAARSAAWSAARAAAWAAARSAAWAAARSAAWAAAWAAARDAAWSAAMAAAMDAAMDAELRKAIVRALEWLGDYADGREE